MGLPILHKNILCILVNNMGKHVRKGCYKKSKIFIEVLENNLYDVLNTQLCIFQKSQQT